MNDIPHWPPSPTGLAISELTSRLVTSSLVVFKIVSRK